MASGKKTVVRRVKASSDNASASPQRRKASADKSASVVKPIQPIQPTRKKRATEVAKKVAKPARKPLIIFVPFIALGRYFRNSWRELRQVEWPSRRATWQMTLGIILFCLVIGIFVLLSDWGSQWLIREVIL